MRWCFSVLFLFLMENKVMTSPSGIKTKLSGSSVLVSSIGNSSSLVYVKFNECCDEYPAACQDRDTFERMRNSMNYKLDEINNLWLKVKRDSGKIETKALRRTKPRDKIRNLQSNRRPSTRSPKPKSFLKFKRKEERQRKCLTTRLKILGMKKTLEESITLASDMHNDIATVGQECSQVRDLARESVVRIKNIKAIAKEMIKMIHL